MYMINRPSTSRTYPLVDISSYFQSSLVNYINAVFQSDKLNPLGTLAPKDKWEVNFNECLWDPENTDVPP